MNRPALLALLAIAALPLGCDKLFDKSGSCELTYDETSPDGSIPKGMAVCFEKWPEEGCTKGELRAVTLGLATSGYVFTKGGHCQEMGYQDCDATRGVYYKECPAAATPGAQAKGGERLGEAMGAPKRAAKETATDTIDAPLSVPTDAPHLGDPNGKRVVHLVLDVQDPFGKRLMPQLKAVIASKSDLKIVARHNPLPFHADALLAHQAALEAMSQKGNEAFWQLYDLMADNQRQLKQADLVGYAGQVGLDVSAFEAALNSRKHEARVRQDMKEVAAAGLRAVPILVMDTRLLKGAQPESQIEKFLGGG